MDLIPMRLPERPGGLRWRTALGAGIAIAVFVVDCNTHRGTAASVPYVALPLLCLWAAHPREVLVWTAVAVLLAAAGWFLSVDGNDALPSAHHSHAAFNRIVSLAAIVATGLIVFQNRRAQRQLLRLATRDPLTGLSNRRALDDRLQDQCERSARSGRSFAVCLIDLDGFKAVNDRYGHAAGDRLLERVAQALTSAVRRYETVARIGGDEFVVILEDVADADEALRVTRRLLDAIGLGQPKTKGSHRVGASAGVALRPLHAEDATGLLRQADAAMYRAKQAGGGIRLARPAQRRPTETATAGSG
jgi:diguanylate cyclase (GGDEF)-like protein